MDKCDVCGDTHTPNNITFSIRFKKMLCWKCWLAATLVASRMSDSDRRIE